MQEVKNAPQPDAADALLDQAQQLLTKRREKDVHSKGSAPMGCKDFVSMLLLDAQLRPNMVFEVFDGNQKIGIVVAHGLHQAMMNVVSATTRKTASKFGADCDYGSLWIKPLGTDAVLPLYALLCDQ